MIEAPIVFIIPYIPMPYNQAMRFLFQQKRWYLCKEAVQFKSMVQINTPEVKVDAPCWLITLRHEYYANWFCKNGNVKKKDVQNMNRLLIDALTESIGIDDCRVWGTLDEKKQWEGKEFTRISIWIVAIGQTWEEIKEKMTIKE